MLTTSPEPHAQPRHAPRKRLLEVCAPALTSPVVALGLLLGSACHRTSPELDPSHTRVISQTALSDEILWNLGPEARARVAAISSLADDPQYSDVAGRWPTDVPRLAGQSEALLARTPDLVIIASFTAPETQAMLRAQKVKLRVLDGFTGFADYRTHVRAIAGDLGLQAAGDTYLRSFDTQLQQLKSRVVEASPRPRVVTWHAGNTAGSQTTFQALTDTLALENIPAANGRTGHFALTGEQLIAWDPDIIVTACAPDLATDNGVENGCVRAERQLAAMPGIAATKAARNRGVLAIPPRMLFSSGSGMLDACEYMHTQMIERKLAPGATP